MKTLRVVLILALVAIAVGLSPMTAKAGAFASYASSIQLQNLDGDTSTVNLFFYDKNGNEVANVVDTLDAYGQKYWYPLPAEVGDTFDGSVVVTSTTNVASISNIVGGNGTASAAYIAESAGALTVTLPVLMKANGAFSSWFNVQNAGSDVADITVTYSDGTTNSFADLAKGAAHTFDNAAETHNSKIFAATVTSDQPIVVTVILESTRVLFAHNGFTAPSTEPVMPLINIQPSKSIQTGVNLANAGDAETTVTVAYTPAVNSAGTALGTYCEETQTIPAHQYKTFALVAFSTSANSTVPTTADCVKGALFVGSARVIDNTASQPLAIVVSQLTGTQNGSAYNAFDPTAATGTFVTPLVMDRNNSTLKLFTTINMMNVSETLSTKIKCTFTNTTYTWESGTLEPGQGTTAFQNNVIAAGYVGGATCTAETSGAQIIAVVNEAADIATTNDLVLTFEAINIP